MVRFQRRVTVTEPVPEWVTGVTGRKWRGEKRSSQIMFPIRGKKTMGMSQNPMLVNPTAGFKCWCIDVKPPQIYLVGGIPTPLKNMKVNWDDYSQSTESHKIPWFQTTNQVHSINLRFWPIPILLQCSGAPKIGTPLEIRCWWIRCAPSTFNWQTTWFALMDSSQPWLSRQPNKNRWIVG